MGYLEVLAWPVAIVLLVMLPCFAVKKVCDSFNNHVYMKVVILREDVRFIQNTELEKLHAFIKLAELKQLPSQGVNVEINLTKELEK